MQRLVYLLTSLFFLFGCKTQKDLEQTKESPQWISGEFSKPYYYSGMGMANNSGTEKEAVAAAQQTAFLNLFKQVDDSVMRKVVMASAFYDSFNPNDVYQNDSSIWVYYQITRDSLNNYYQQVKEHDTQLAYNALQQGIDYQNQNPAKAIEFYTEVLEISNTYAPHSLCINVSDTALNLNAEVEKNLKILKNSFKIVALEQTINVKKGEALKRPIEFYVTYNNAPINDIPIEISYTGDSTLIKQANTQENGIITFSMTKVKANKKEELVKAGISQSLFGSNKQAIALNTGNLKAQTKLHISSPVMAYHIEDKQDYFRFNHQSFIPCLDSAAHRYNLILMQHPSPSDLHLNISYNIHPKTTLGGGHKANIQLQLLLKNQNTQTHKQLTYSKITGEGNTPELAANDAWKNMINMLEKELMNNLMDKYFQEN